MIDLIIMYGAILLGLIFCYLVYKFDKKIKIIVKKNKDESILFGRSIVTGMISGVFVIALDRIITQYIKSKPSVDVSSWYNFLLSLSGIIIVSFLIASFILLIIFGLIYRGLSVTFKKR